MMKLWCENTEEHDGHEHEKPNDASCTGWTSCGQHSHAPHHFVSMMKVWCPGICACGLRVRLHGPGAHK